MCNSQLSTVLILNMEFKQNNKNGDNKVLIQVKGDFINTPNNKIEEVLIRDQKYVRKSIFEKILLCSSLIVNIILIYQFINSLIK